LVWFFFNLKSHSAGAEKAAISWLTPLLFVPLRMVGIIEYAQFFEPTHSPPSITCPTGAAFFLMWRDLCVPWPFKAGNPLSTPPLSFFFAEEVFSRTGLPWSFPAAA